MVCLEPVLDLQSLCKFYEHLERFLYMLVQYILQTRCIMFQGKCWLARAYTSRKS